jgi:pimeloyl-ACP methyl ester carboxylesterase
MAGGPVFRMAQRTPALFAVGTALQGLLVRLAPGAVIRALFAGASGREAALAADPHFRRMVTSLMRRAYGPCRAGYVRDIRLYVGPWGESFTRLAAPPAIWQGAEDTWTPPSMARRIAELAPAPPRLTLLPELGHYATLFAAVPRILAEVGAAAA